MNEVVAERVRVAEWALGQIRAAKAKGLILRSLVLPAEDVERIARVLAPWVIFWFDPKRGQGVRLTVYEPAGRHVLDLYSSSAWSLPKIPEIQ